MKVNSAMNHETFWQQKEFKILARRAVECGPLIGQTVARVVTERYNKTSYFGSSLSQIYHERAATDRENIRGRFELCYRGENMLFVLVSYWVEYLVSVTTNQ